MRAVNPADYSWIIQVKAGTIIDPATPDNRPLATYRLQQSQLSRLNACSAFAATIDDSFWIGQTKKQLGQLFIDFMFETEENALAMRFFLDRE